MPVVALDQRGGRAVIGGWVISNCMAVRHLTRGGG